MGVGRKRAAELWAELQKIKSRHIKINVDGHGFWVTAHDPGRRIPGLASGGAVPSHAALGAGGPTSDDVPLMASVGEHMLTAREVQAAGGHQSVYRLRAAILRGDVQGLAKGGPVVSLSGDRRDTSVVVGEVTKPIKSGMNELFRAIGDSMAAQWKRYAASGGPVVQVARAQIGDPYVWGATGPNAFDCSGLVMYAWLHGAGKRFGRTTYDHRRNLRTISSPIPGAVGQPHPDHEYLYAGNGKIIEAAHTGTPVREVYARGGEWWGYPKARGGPIERALGEDFVRTGRHAKAVALGLLAGDPGIARAFASGGLQAGYALGPTLLGERTSGGEAYVPLAPSRRAAAEDLMADVAHRFGGVYARRVPVGAGRGAVTEVHKHVTNQIMPGAQVTVAEPVDIDMLAQRLEFHLIAAQPGS
ncbi:C40 family peptidase [Actinomadura sp. BRA 177]|nr:C40 family peptidase [Actinomadura sp. BRA 177]